MKSCTEKLPGAICRYDDEDGKGGLTCINLALTVFAEPKRTSHNVKLVPVMTIAQMVRSALLVTATMIRLKQANVVAKVMIARVNFVARCLTPRKSSALVNAAMRTRRSQIQMGANSARTNQRD